MSRTTSDPQPGLFNEVVCADASGRTPTRKRPREFVAGYAVAVMCRDESHQEQGYDALRAMGYELKVLTL